MEDQDRDHELGEHAEVLIDHLNKELKRDEKGRSYFRKEAVLNLVFRVADFMRQLSKRI